MRVRPVIAVLFALWCVTRLALGWIAAHDDEGPYRDRTPAANDIVSYEFWADRIADGERPYEDFPLEYPPANIPLFVVPDVVATSAGVSYETAFLWLTAAVDLVAFAGLIRLAAPGGHWLAPGAWLVGLPLLGPVAPSRLDVVPAAALVWAIVWLRDDRAVRAGVGLGIAAGTKVFAGLLVPVWALVLWTRSSVGRLAAGAVAAGLPPLLLFADQTAALRDSVWTYHSSRGIAAESSWGSLLLLGGALSGSPIGIELRFGAWELLHSSADTLKTLATLAVVTVVVHACFVARRARVRGDLETIALLSASTVLLSVGLGNIFSAQYVLWCLGAVAAATAVGGRARLPLALLVGAAALSHLVYPFLFFDIIGDQQLVPVTVLVARNALVLAAGVLVVRSAMQRTGPAPVSDPGVEEDEPVPVGA